MKRKMKNKEWNLDKELNDKEEVRENAKGKKWTEITFGKYKGKTIPQILFKDPNWFFSAVESKLFKGELKKEAQELSRKAKYIKIPPKCNYEIDSFYTYKIVAYFIDPYTKKYLTMSISDYKKTKSIKNIRNFIFERDSFDLSIVREINPYDQNGSKLFLKDIKFHLFGDPNYRMTKKQCEEFFGCDSNFSFKRPIDF